MEAPVNKNTETKEEETVSITANFKTLTPKERRGIRVFIAIVIIFAIGAVYFGFIAPVI